jgi:predicted transcriptional regulator
MSFSKQVAQVANHVKRSGGWIMKQALSAGIDQEENAAQRYASFNAASGG